MTHGQGLSWTQVTVTGKDSHTGSTPMPMRYNAGLGMARMLELVDEIAWSHKPDAVGAAGHIDVYPNSRNVIPGKVVFTVDFRSPQLDVINDMESRFKEGAQKIADDMGLSVEFEKVGREAAAPVADALCEALAGGNGAALEAFRFRRSASFAHDYGSWHCGTDAEGGHNHGLISGLERTLQTAVNDSLRAGRRKSATSQTSGASRPSGSGAAGATAGAGRPAAAVRKKVVKKKVAKKKAGKKRGPGA